MNSRRSFGGAQADFARQLAERQQASRPQKKFRTSAPKGSSLASGYVDRTNEREDKTDDDRAERLKALEESLKEETIDQETFDRLRFQVAGGDLESTHLVKGLDFKLLARIKRGEDVSKEEKDETIEEPAGAEDVDDEFDEIEQQEIQAIAKEKSDKKGQVSTVSLAPGKKRTRDQILAELKASRQAAKAQQESALGGRFAKIGAKKTPGSRIERDGKGREVLIIIDEDGHEKRKVRKVQPGDDDEALGAGLLMPDADAKPLGMEVPEQFRKIEEPQDDEEVDIFAGVGDDYDPLAGMDDSDSGSDEEEADTAKEAKGEDEGEMSENSAEAMPPPPVTAAAPRNYFKDSKTNLMSSETTTKAPSMSDPAIMAAIKRAAALKHIDDEDSDQGEDGRKAKAAELRRKKLLETADRDDVDIDMGFGTSRFEDEEDFEDSKVKLSVWGGGDDDEEGGTSRGAKAKRKRGEKKRKGDANNAADVLRVMEQRKKS